MPHPASGTERHLRRGVWTDLAPDDVRARARAVVRAGLSAENRRGGLAFVLASVLLVGAIVMAGVHMRTSAPTVMGSGSSTGGYPRDSQSPSVPPSSSAPGIGRAADATALVDRRAERVGPTRVATPSHHATRLPEHAAPDRSRGAESRRQHASDLAGTLDSLSSDAVSSVDGAVTSASGAATSSVPLGSENVTSLGATVTSGRRLGHVMARLSGSRGGLLSGW